MKALEDKIRDEGRILEGNILKVDHFLNHQIDPQLMAAVGETFANYFKTYAITKIITIETSGIAPAVFAGLALGVPVIFAKKQKSLTLVDNLISADVYSYTKQVTNRITISKDFLDEHDRVLLIDDFLANGQAIKGLVNICQQIGAKVEGVGIVIEKSFQPGRQLIEEMGLPIYSLARIASIDAGGIRFVEESGA